MGPRVPASLRFVIVGAVTAVLLGGCMSIGGFGGGAKPQPAAAPGQTPDIRRYLGPNYCPELRVQPGTEFTRSATPGGEDDPRQVIWQGSIGDTARECLYDLQGNLTIRVGVSGRVIAGPAGGQSTVTLPIRIAVVKYQEAVLSSNVVPISVTIPPQLSTVFREVREVVVPAPGSALDYIIYVGFDDGNPVPIGETRRSAGALDLEATDIVVDPQGQADLLANPGN